MEKQHLICISVFQKQHFKVTSNLQIVVYMWEHRIKIIVINVDIEKYRFVESISSFFMDFSFNLFVK